MGSPKMVVLDGGEQPFLAYLQSIIDAAGGAMWPFQEATGAYAQAYNTALATGRDIVINGTMDADSVWNKGVGCTIAAGVMSFNVAGNISTTQALPVDSNRTYTITFDVVVTSGQLNIKLGGTNIPPTWIAASGSYSFDVVCGPTDKNLTLFTHSSLGFVGTVDNVTVKRKDILASSSYPGAEVLVDGDMEAADTSAWTASANTLLSKETTNPHGGSRVLRVTDNGAGYNYGYQAQRTSAGKRYIFHGYMRGDGTNNPIVWHGSGSPLITGSISTDWQEKTVEFIGIGSGGIYLLTNGSDGHYSEFDDISVTEVNPLNASISGATIAQDAGAFGLAYLFDGLNDYVNVYSNTLNSFLNPSAGTLLAVVQASGAGVWTDGVSRYLAILGADANNYTLLRKDTTANRLAVYYAAGGIFKGVVDTSLAGSTAMFMLAMTWDKTADEMKMFLNGSQVGTTQTSLGTWVGNLASTTATIGASITTPSNIWSGLIAYPALFRVALTPAQILEIAQKAGVA